MTFFFDANIGRPLVMGLRGFGEDVLHYSERFDEGVIDEEWLEAVGKEGLFLVTRDKRIFRRPLQRDAWRRHRVGAFVLSGKEMGTWKQVLQLVRAWPTIKRLAEETIRPFAFKFDRHGNLTTQIPLP